MCLLSDFIDKYVYFSIEMLLEFERRLLGKRFVVIRRKGKKVYLTYFNVWFENLFCGEKKMNLIQSNGSIVCFKLLLEKI